MGIAQEIILKIVKTGLIVVIVVHFFVKREIILHIIQNMNLKENFDKNYSNPIKKDFSKPTSNQKLCCNALLDSGANKIFMNNYGWQILKSLGLKLEDTNIDNVILANNKSSSIVGKICLPISLENKTVVFEVYIMPELRYTLILGTNFWVSMGIIPD